MVEGACARLVHSSDAVEVWVKVGTWWRRSGREFGVSGSQKWCDRNGSREELRILKSIITIRS
jgi:hypothetical protein